MAGISRSATIVIAYLIKKYEYSVPAVLTLLQRKRCKVKIDEILDKSEFWFHKATGGLLLRDGY